MPKLSCHRLLLLINESPAFGTHATVRCSVHSLVLSCYAELKALLHYTTLYITDVGEREKTYELPIFFGKCTEDGRARYIYFIHSDVYLERAIFDYF